MADISVSFAATAPRKPNGQFIARNFWDRVEKTSTCWLWTGPTFDWAGHLAYGKAHYHGKTMHAHRVAWMLTHGEIFPGILVLHRCDNPPCVNPAHLFLGTSKDNTQDSIKKNRFRVFGMHPGDTHNQAKITWEQVRAIRALYKAGGITQQALGDIYHLTQSQISHIVHNKSWKE